MYRVKEDIIWQKDYRIGDNDNIFDYLKCNADSNESLTDDTLIVVAKQGKMYELNLTAAIIFEGIVNGKSIENEIANSFTELFDISETEVITHIHNCINQLLLSELLEEVE